MFQGFPRESVVIYPSISMGIFLCPLQSLERLFCSYPSSVGCCCMSYSWLKQLGTLHFILFPWRNRHEAELAAAASQPLPDDDDDAFE